MTFRFLHGRFDYVSVYNARNEYLGDAVWDKIQTVAQAGETAQTRRGHIKTMTLDLERIAELDAEAVAANRARVLAELAAEGSDYRHYDDDEDAPVPAPGTPGGTSHRKSRTAKKKPVKRKAGSAGTPTPAQRAAEQRRKDAADAANWSREQSA